MEKLTRRLTQLHSPLFRGAPIERVPVAIGVEIAYNRLPFAALNRRIPSVLLGRVGRMHPSLVAAEPPILSAAPSE
jgi:hypothetical protein